MKLGFQYGRALLFIILLVTATRSYAQECGVVYVTPTGASSGVAGTKANPANLTYGLTLVSPTAERVWMAMGTYTINNTLTIPSNVTIEGGFTSGTWVKSNATPTTIQRSALNPDATNLALVGLTANGASGFRLQDLYINVANAPGNQYSTYGLRLVGCSNYNVTRCNISPGTPGNGTNGVAGATGATGSNATAGTTGNDDNTAAVGHGGNGGNGGGTGFGAGGTAPAIPSGCCAVGANGNTGAAPGNSRAGGGGGSGANGGQSNNRGGTGGTGNGAAGTVAGGAASPTAGCCNPTNNYCTTALSGGNGGNGAVGATGATGATGVGSNIGGYWVPGNGANGGDGQGGQGGSGGGGGAGEGITGLCVCIPGAGSGGGGGGGGGEGGAGGTGGTGGGSSFAVYLYNNGSGGSFTDCNLVTGTAGTGGLGAAGGVGGGGGTGAGGGSYGSGDIGCGGTGGNGAAGGKGGQGGDGGAGIALNIYQDPGGITAATSNITAIPGLPPTISVNNKGCIDADVTFSSPTSGNWSFGVGASPATGTGAGPINVRYSSLGRKTVTFSGTVFTDYIDIFNTPGNTGGFISPGDTTLPVGCYHDFTSDSVGTNYTWIFQGANVDTVTGPTHRTVDSVYFLSPGTYLVTCRVTSPNSCCGFLDDTITVTAQPNTINVTLAASNSTVCVGTPITYTASPTGYQLYDFYINNTVVQSSTQNSFTTSALQPGDSVTVRAFDGICYSNPSATLYPTVNVPPSLVLGSSATSSICSGDTVTFSVTPTGLASYSFYNGTTLVQQGPLDTYVTDSLAPGNSITVIAANGGCPDTSNAIVTTVNITPALVLSSNDTTLCAGDPITFTTTPAGLANYQFFENGVSVQNSASNTYTNTSIADGTQVTAVGTSANGCISDTTPAIMVTVYALPAITLTSSDPNDTICFGDNITFTATPTGLSNYNFISHSVSLQNSGSNTYTTTTLPTGSDTVKVVYNINGCLDTSNAIVITVNPIPTITLSANNTTICAGSSITVTATPAGYASYNFMVNGGSVQNTASNTYSTSSINNGDAITATTVANGCPSAASTPINVTVNQIPTVTLASSDADNIICQGAAITFTASPAGYNTYDFQNNGTSLQATNSNTYTTSSLPVGNSITVIAINNGCRDTSTAIVTTVTPAPAANAGPDNQLCIDAVPVTIAGTPAGGTWSGTGISPTGTFTPSTAGAGNATLVYTTTDPASGCLGHDTAVYTVYPLPLADAGNDVTICETDSTILVATGGVNYVWSPSTGLSTTTNAQVTANPTNTTVYHVTVTDANSCINTDSVTVTVEPKPQASFTNNTACAGQPTIFNNTSTGNTYHWNFGDGTSATDTNAIHTYSTGGLYPVILVAFEGNCSDTATNNVTVYSNPVSNATINPTLAVAEEDSILFNADTAGITYWNWDLGNGDSAHLPQFYYTYQDTGVYQVSLVTINANGCTDTLVFIDSLHIIPPARIYVPNAFTPNQDGRNDKFWVFGSGVKYFHFWIYDRWGTLVFETRDMTQGWDGTYNGKLADPGVYVYQLSVDFESTLQKHYKGSITLIR